VAGECLGGGRSIPLSVLPAGPIAGLVVPRAKDFARLLVRPTPGRAYTPETASSEGSIIALESVPGLALTSFFSFFFPFFRFPCRAF